MMPRTVLGAASRRLHTEIRPGHPQSTDMHFRRPISPVPATHRVPLVFSRGLTCKSTLSAQYSSDFRDSVSEGSASQSSRGSGGSQGSGASQGSQKSQSKRSKGRKGAKTLSKAENSKGRAQRGGGGRAGPQCSAAYAFPAHGRDVSFDTTSRAPPGARVSPRHPALEWSPTRIRPMPPPGRPRIKRWALIST